MSFIFTGKCMAGEARPAFSARFGSNAAPSDWPSRIIRISYPCRANGLKLGTDLTPIFPRQQGGPRVVRTANWRTPSHNQINNGVVPPRKGQFSESTHQGPRFRASIAYIDTGRHSRIMQERHQPHLSLLAQKDQIAPKFQNGSCRSGGALPPGTANRQHLAFNMPEATKKEGIKFPTERRARDAKNGEDKIQAPRLLTHSESVSRVSSRLQSEVFRNTVQRKNPHLHPSNYTDQTIRF